MTQAKKPAKSHKKAITDIDKPGDSKPPATSKPVIVTNRPILKDPMMTSGDSSPADSKTDEEKKELAHSTAPVIKPLDKPQPESEPEKPAEPAKLAEPETPEKEPEPEKPELAPKTDDKPASAKPANSNKQKPDVETAEQAKREAAIQHLIDSKKYELPINAVEKRKSKRFVVMGIVLAILLVLAWGDIAADAGIIHINGVKPVTHFFSN